MNCPACGNVNLVMSERQGIEIDYCPTCRGVWLDRGELDKIIERSSSTAAAPPPAPPQQSGYQPRYEDQHRRPHHDDSYKYKKKKGFMSELFDFD